MQAFLQEAATELLKRREKFACTAAVLPTRRAAVYLRHYLQQQVQQTVLLPQIASIEDFFFPLAHLNKAEPLSLLIALHRKFAQIAPNTEAIERFAQKGYTLLADLNVLESNLQPEEIERFFRSLHESEAVKRWAEQLGTDEPATGQFAQQYFTFWQLFAKIYKQYRAELLKSEIGFSGLIYRELLPKLPELLAEAGIEKLHFIGFGLLTNVEQQIIGKTVELGKAVLHFDADILYTNNPEHQAGLYFRKFKKMWLGEAMQPFAKHIGQQPLQVNIVDTADRAGMARVCGEQLNEWLLQAKATPESEEAFCSSINQIAVLLPDEGMLYPLLYALPDIKIKGEPLHEFLNITMGLPLHQTPFNDLVTDLLQLQEQVIQADGQNAYSTKLLLRLLHHPYLYKHPLLIKNIDALEQHIEKEKLREIDEASLSAFSANVPFLPQLLECWNNTTSGALPCLIELMRLLDVYIFTEQPLEQMLVRELVKLLKRLADTVQQLNEPLSLSGFRQFLLEAMRNQRIPFTGQPLGPVQLMGMLESRALDFKKVIILSCNEAYLPGSKQGDSFIPYDLRMLHKLPTHRETQASVAHTFYRLFHRAEEVVLLHTNPEASKEAGGKSRYLLQMAAEWDAIENIKIKEQQLNLPAPVPAARPLALPNTAGLQQLILQRLQKPLYPTNLNRLLTNPKEFIAEHVLGAKAKEEDEDGLGVRNFGTLLHELLEEDLKPFVVSQQSVGEKELKELLNNKSRVRAYANRFLLKQAGRQLAGSGYNKIQLETLLQLRQLYWQQRSSEVKQTGAFKVVALEKRVSKGFKWQLPNGENVTITLAGLLDCIELHQGNVYKVIDYKTGRFDAKDLIAKSADDLLKVEDKNGRWASKDKLIQLLCYRYLWLRELSDNANINEQVLEQVASGFYFLRSYKGSFKPYTLKDQPEAIADFLPYVESIIGQILEPLFTAAAFEAEPMEVELTSAL
jgi:hypothetical protein